MAGFARLMRSIWDDMDFRSLTAGAQRLYVYLVSHPRLSLAGSVTLQPRKWAHAAADLTTDDINEAIAELVERDYVLVDEDAEELLVRTFIRHDGGYRTPNIHKAIESAVSRIESDALRAVAASELVQVSEKPSAQGLSQLLAEPLPEGMRHLPSSSSSEQPFIPASQQPSSRGTENRDGCTYDDLSSAAAAAVDIFIEHRVAAGGIHNPPGFAIRLRRDEPAAHADELATLAPDADPIDAAVRIFGIPLSAAIQADGIRRARHSA